MSFPPLEVLALTDAAWSETPSDALHRFCEALGPRGGVVLRGPTLRDRALLARVEREARVTRAHGSWLFVSTALAVFRAARDELGPEGLGLALPEAAVAPADARAFVGPAPILASRHDLEGAARALHDGADAVLISPVFETPSKPGGTPLGLDGLRAIVAGLPAGARVFALGGIEASNAAAVRGAGAVGVAAIRAAFGPDPGALAPRPPEKSRAGSGEPC